MTTRVLIIGGYGNFGGFIARVLARENNIKLIISGRNEKKASQFASTLTTKNKAEFSHIDINHGLENSLLELKPDLVIHTSGPFQGQSYHVAEACIRTGCHYIDLADSRKFVAGIDALDKKATDKNIFICTGTSSVPCLTSAIVDKYIDDFKELKSIDYGIATAHLTNRGLATTSAVLSYAGKPFTTLIDGAMKNIYGWRDLRFRKFWCLNKRPLGNCDIPDLELFPKRYPTLENIRFQAGLELRFLHYILWVFSGVVKLKLFPPLNIFAPYLLKISRLFDSIGKDDSGFYMRLIGIGKDNNPKEVLFELVAHQSDGLFIPSMPAILLTKKIAKGEINNTGAIPCMGIITLDEYLEGLSEFDIHWRVTN